MIAEPRSVIFDYVDSLTTEAVFHWFPDDVGEVPCVVVGRPTLRFVSMQGAATFPVIVVGRNLTDDAQAELDTLTDELAGQLFKGVPGLTVRVIAVDPAVESIGGSDFPVYVITLEYLGNYC